MGRGVSAGGGQSSLGYLFGGGEETTTNTKGPQAPQNDPRPSKADPSPKPATVSPPAGARTAGVHSSTTNNYMRADGQNCGNFLTHEDRIPKPAAVSPPPGARTAGIHSSTTNNYMRADGQNCGNFLTERPSTKVHAAPGGGSSLGYLFGDGKN